MSDQLRWGILGTGNIARQFTDGIKKTAKRSRITAVGSRSPETAKAFAQPREIGNVHGSYEALLADPAVEAIYNSLPNSLHHDWTIKALRAGKHVLCEKPFAMTHREAEEMFDEARKAGRVLVEAFMYRSHPLTHAVIDAVRGGEIGELKLIRTSFCYKTNRETTDIRFQRALGGGGLMDVGCYCINFARMFAGEEPAKIHASGHMHETGVDDLVGATMKFPSGIVAVLACGNRVHADNTAYVCGTEGYIEIPCRGSRPRTARRTRSRARRRRRWTWRAARRCARRARRARSTRARSSTPSKPTTSPPPPSTANRRP
jgi:D-xylose 1-dehydrogenase (NADP+, D-xylono-1,5-lactone-forming)